MTLICKGEIPVIFKHSIGRYQWMCWVFLEQLLIHYTITNSGCTAQTMVANGIIDVKILSVSVGNKQVAIPIIVIVSEHR